MSIKHSTLMHIRERKERRALQDDIVKIAQQADIQYAKATEMFQRFGDGKHTLDDRQTAELFDMACDLKNTLNLTRHFLLIAEKRL